LLIVRIRKAGTPGQVRQRTGMLFSSRAWMPSMSRMALFATGISLIESSGTIGVEGVTCAVARVHARQVATAKRSGRMRR